MDDAELLRGAELRVPESDAAAAARRRFYHFQLIGCEVATVGGAAVGTVRAVEGEAGNHRLSIAADERGSAGAAGRRRSACRSTWRPSGS